MIGRNVYNSQMEGGREFDKMPIDRTQLREWARKAMCGFNDATQEDAKEAARAVLEAIREPTPKMIENGNIALSRNGVDSVIDDVAKKVVTPATPLANNNSGLQAKTGQSLAIPKQLKLDLGIEVERVVGGIEMGVLENGIPYLTQRGLAEMTGAANCTERSIRRRTIFCPAWVILNLLQSLRAQLWGIMSQRSRMMRAKVTSNDRH